MISKACVELLGACYEEVEDGRRRSSEPGDLGEEERV